MTKILTTMKGLINEELRGILKSQNLPHTGKKDVLLERLGWAELVHTDPQIFDWDPVITEDSPGIRPVLFVNST